MAGRGEVARAAGCAALEGSAAQGGGWVAAVRARAAAGWGCGRRKAGETANGHEPGTT